MSRKLITIDITITVPRSSIITDDERSEIAARFSECADNVSKAITAGSLCETIRFKVGTADAPEEAKCRWCQRTVSQIVAEDGTFHDWSEVSPLAAEAFPTSGTFEAKVDCGCQSRNAQKTAEANRKELMRRQPVIVVRDKSPAELEAEIKVLAEKLAALGK